MDNFNNNQQGYQQPMGQPMQQQPMGQPMQQQPMNGYQQPMGQPMQQQPMNGYQQPMGGYQQPMNGYQQPMGGYQQPMNYGRPAGGANIGGYFTMLGQNKMRLLGFISAILIFLAPFFNWASYKEKYDGHKYKWHGSMFKVGDDLLDSGLVIFMAILILLIGVCLILWDMADYIPAIGNLKYKLGNVPMQYILVGVALLFGLLVFFNGDLMDYLEAAKDSLDNAKDVYDAKGHANHGFGPIVLFLGVIGNAASAFLSNKR